MNLDTIVMDPAEAKARVDEYQQLRDDERTLEDQQIEAAYRAAARGLPCISLGQVVDAGGYFDGGLPRIAVARADATTVWVTEQWGSSPGRTAFVYTDKAATTNRGALVGQHSVRVTVPRRYAYSGRGRTVVPIIPPRFRPHRWRIRGYHILWEVESWTPEPPHDPALIKHLGGDLWAVHAVWDLTEIERRVLGGY